ncbi:DUF1963 domain-containing protein [Aquimarina algicola]|uniref:DUF1963 domain-containing protein n=1 Tax=Aquimarina algicola TaxID=2589995 RepID=A0A504IY72_9FLAO|nr:DUF1963 domain-containing protein [Aquimarina algicola]TPN83406.1 DUF1963 domain-containing protein [Aquimarina algicola]
MIDIKKRLIEEIEKYEWDNVDDVIKSIMPNIIFSVDKNESDLSILNSRFGGAPAVPEDFVWPVQSLTNNAPLAFFFQINFEEIKPYDVANLFPDHGILLCFASVTDDIMWEYDVKDAFKVYFFSDTENLNLAKIPEEIPLEQRLAPRDINFKNSYQLPRYPFNYELGDDISEDDADGIDEVADIIFDKAIMMQHRIELAKGAGLQPPTPEDDFYTFFSHNILQGVPFSVQHYIAEKWSDLYKKYDKKNNDRENYINLISFEMRGKYGYGFSMNGAHLYLCMHQKDLANLDFKNTIAIVQNT